MPPRTRSSLSSLPATPSAKSFASTSTTPRTTPRKVPCCTKCGKPRAGHPRSGCPFEDSESPLRVKQEPDLTNALSYLRIETLASERDDKATLRARRAKMSMQPEASLASLSSTSSDIVNRLSKPGIMGDDTDVEDEESRKGWQKAIVTPTKAPTVRTYMPCTLNTPGSSVFSSRDGSAFPEELKHSSQDTSSSTPSALSRTWSTEERTAFLDDLVKVATSPPTTVYRFPLSDIDTFQHSAMKLGFYSRIIEDVDGVHGSLILGRDKHAVEEVFYGVTRGVEGEAGKSGNGRGTAFAGGAVVGAVATFAGLAYS
jgi:hypothetical protein